MTEQDVVNLMSSSKTEFEWDANCDIVKSVFSGYPAFWFKSIILSGVAAKTISKFVKE